MNSETAFCPNCKKEVVGKWVYFNPDEDQGHEPSLLVCPICEEGIFLNE